MNSVRLFFIVCLSNTKVRKNSKERIYKNCPVDSVSLQNNFTAVKNFFSLKMINAKTHQTNRIRIFLLNKTESGSSFSIKQNPDPPS